MNAVYKVDVSHFDLWRNWMARISVLLVDDNITFLSILKNYVQEHWRDELDVVGVATDGKDALEQASTLKPQVVLLDLVMTGVNGFQVIPLLKQALPQTRIIVLTLLDTPDYRQTSLAAGADDFVAKEHLDTDLPPAFARIMQNLELDWKLEVGKSPAIQHSTPTSNVQTLNSSLIEETVNPTDVVMRDEEHDESPIDQNPPCRG